MVLPGRMLRFWLLFLSRRSGDWCRTSEATVVVQLGVSESVGKEKEVFSGCLAGNSTRLAVPSFVLLAGR